MSSKRHAWFDRRDETAVKLQMTKNIVGSFSAMAMSENVQEPGLNRR
jgi:hypothetical protein